MPAGAHGVTLVEMDRGAYETLGETGEIKVQHVDGHMVLIRVVDGDMPTDPEEPRRTGVQ